MRFYFVSREGITPLVIRQNALCVLLDSSVHLPHLAPLPRAAQEHTRLGVKSVAFLALLVPIARTQHLPHPHANPGGHIEHSSAEANEVDPVYVPEGQGNCEGDMVPFGQ